MPVAQRFPRRTLLQSGLFAGASLAIPFQALLSRASAHGSRRGASYGELAVALDEATGLPLLKLPPGFRYRTFGWKTSPMTDGVPTPAMHDGMAVVAASGDRVVLVRNHELDANGQPFTPPELTYDAAAPAGTTNLVFNTATGAMEQCWASLGGTLRNCAGGATPWGSWLTCEETLHGPGDKHRFAADGELLAYQQPHGYVFEVPAGGRAAPVPLKAMGRFSHEAVAVDPATGYVYLTEDMKPGSGFYRFTPSVPGQLSQGGTLEMLRADSGQVTDLTGGFQVGREMAVDWVPIADPDRRHQDDAQNDMRGCQSQGVVQQAALFARLEGCVYHGGLVYFVATSGGAAGAGQIWEFNAYRQKLRLIYESPDKVTLNAPDNLAVSPRGGLVLCQDSDEPGQKLFGLTQAGELFTLAENDMVLNGQPHSLTGDFRDVEWAGALFTPDGKWLIVNLQSPGLTIAITGPWESGPL